MRAFIVEAKDQNPVIKHVKHYIPAEGELLVDVTACGVNFADLLMLQGVYQDTPEFPFVPGMEICGRVVSHGPRVSAPPVGTRVVAFIGSGGFAEQAVVSASRCVPVPDAMSDTDAAGFLIAYGTSHLALERRARLKEGEHLVVTGAAGGVGLTAVEIGKQMGARVTAIVRGTEKQEIARAAGADTVIDASLAPEAITQCLKAEGGVDVVYDAVGDPLFDALFRACNPEARVLVIGFAGGTVPKPRANHMLVKNIDIIGFYWGGYMKFSPQALTKSVETLLGWYTDGRIRPHISHVLPLEKTADALDLLRSRTSTGKVVVCP